MNKKSVSYALGGATHTGSHILPVNTVRSRGAQLFTAGRDGALVLYGDGGGIENHIQLHCDWANDVVWHSPTTLVSCSSDLSVQWWDHERNEHGLVGHHEDYVKTMARTRDGFIATGGLDKVVNLWDVAAAKKLHAFSNDHGELGSVYSMDSAGPLVAFGDNMSKVTLIDTRSNAVVKILEGHTDTVKSLVMSETGCLSGSSDGLVKLWDLRSFNQVKTWDYGAAVWSLHCPDPQGLTTFYTGTIDGNLRKTRQDITETVGQEARGILSICSFQDELWSSTMGDSSLRNWTRPEKSKRGDAGLIKSRLLNNRRYVVTLGTDNEVVLWDIIKCCQLKNFGTKRAFDDVINEYQTQEILPTWCQVMIRAGQLFVVLKETSFMNTEIYGDDLKEYGLSGLEDETRYTLGKILLSSIFKRLVDFEVIRDQELRELRVKEIKSSSKLTNLSILTKFSSQDNIPQHSALSTPVEEMAAHGYFNKTDGESVPPQSAPAALEGDIKDPSTSFRRLKLFSRKSKTTPTTATTEEEGESAVGSAAVTAPGSKTVSRPGTPTTSQPNSNHSSRNTSVEDLDSISTLLQEVRQFYQATTSSGALSQSQLSPPGADEVPLLELPQNLHILVNECPNSSSAEVSVYSDELHNLDLKTLERLLPRWLGMYILKNKCAVRDYPKVGFTIQLDPQSAPLPSLSYSTSRLSAYSMLRTKRILTYITDRFETPTQEMHDGVPVEQWLEVLCHGKVVDNRTTLASLRSVLWKQSGDVAITFRRTTRASESTRSTIL